MAGKSGRSINNVPKSPVKQMIFSWEGILVLLFIAVNIFCANFSEFYNLKSLLRQMPVYLAEICCRWHTFWYLARSIFPLDLSCVSPQQWLVSWQTQEPRLSW